MTQAAQAYAQPREQLPLIARLENGLHLARAFCPFAETERAQLELTDMIGQLEDRIIAEPCTTQTAAAVKLRLVRDGQVMGGRTNGADMLLVDQVMDWLDCLLPRL